MLHSSMLYRLDIFTFLFFWSTAVSQSHSLEIYKNLGFSLPTISFTVNSNADKQFCKYIYLFQPYSMKSVFLLKYALRFFTTLIFSNKSHGLQEKTLYRKK